MHTPRPCPAGVIPVRQVPEVRTVRWRLTGIHHGEHWSARRDGSSGDWCRGRRSGCYAGDDSAQRALPHL